MNSNLTELFFFTPVFYKSSVYEQKSNCLGKPFLHCFLLSICYSLFLFTALYLIFVSGICQCTHQTWSKLDICKQHHFVKAENAPKPWCVGWLVNMEHHPRSTRWAVSHTTAVHSLNLKGVIKGEYNWQRLGKQPETLSPAGIFHCYYYIYYFFPLCFSKISCFTSPPVLVVKNGEVKENSSKGQSC